MSTTTISTLTSIALERPKAIRKVLPDLAEDWLVENFWVGPENQPLLYLFHEDRLPNSAQLSPVILYGESSSGKTALTINLALKWSRHSTGHAMVITTGEAFARDYAAALEVDDVDAFRHKHRLCKLLVIDNLDSLASKPASQDELAATIDSLNQSGKPILLTCVTLPALIKGFQANLISRLSGGYSLQLHRPSQATRNALIRALVAQVDSKLSVEKLCQIADNFSADSLSAKAIETLVKIASQNRHIDGQLDHRVVVNLMRQQLQGVSPDVATITKLVCRRLRVRLSDVRGTTRQANIMRARALAIYLTRKLTTLNLLQIGEFFTGRDHSTILHSINKIHKSLEVDAELASLCRDIEAELLGYGSSSL